MRVEGGVIFSVGVIFEVERGNFLDDEKQENWIFTFVFFVRRYQ